jgi:hypothetical protein
MGSGCGTNRSAAVRGVATAEAVYRAHKESSRGEDMAREKMEAPVKVGVGVDNAGTERRLSHRIIAPV